MGKKSVRADKNIYQLSRENMDLSREAASDLMQFVSADRIDKIENGKAAPHPDEVLAMEKCYRNPELCNYYCTHECPIGRKYVPEASLKDLSQITVEILAAVNSMEQEKNRLIEISVDGRVNYFERDDFDKIIEKLGKINTAIQNMRIWIEHAMNEGKIDEPGCV